MFPWSCAARLPPPVLHVPERSLGTAGGHPCGGGMETRPDGVGGGRAEVSGTAGGGDGESFEKENRLQDAGWVGFTDMNMNNGKEGK